MRDAMSALPSCHGDCDAKSNAAVAMFKADAAYADEGPLEMRGRYNAVVDVRLRAIARAYLCASKRR